MKFTTNRNKDKLNKKRKKRKEEEEAFKQMCKEFDELMVRWDAIYEKKKKKQ